MCITDGDENEMEAVEFDYLKIAEAIRSAYEATERILEPIREVMQSITRALSVFAERISGVISNYMSGITEVIRTVSKKILQLMGSWLTAAGHYIVRVFTSYDRKAPARFAALICVLIKSYSAAYLEHICNARKGFLLRCQDRGNSDSGSDDDNFIITSTTIAAA